VVFDQDGLRLTFDVQPVPGVPGTTAIQARAVNSGLDDLTDFNLQVGRPETLGTPVHSSAVSAGCSECIHLSKMPLPGSYSMSWSHCVYAGLLH
jgi:hypothetical protein